MSGGSCQDQAPAPGEPAAPRLRDVLEAMLFACHKPVTARELVGWLRAAASAEGASAAPALGKINEEVVREALGELAEACQNSDRVYHLRETAGGWQFVSRPEYFPWLKQMFPETRPARLSPPALETLAIIAYRQPITRADIEAVRGVAVDGVMQTLLDRGLVRIAGRAELPGRPLLYETTKFFLEHFGIRSLDELPNADELRKAPLPTAQPQAEEKQGQLALGAAAGGAGSSDGGSSGTAQPPGDGTGPAAPGETAASGGEGAPEGSQ